jgi:membrane protease YdiL (CAAX protease family)
MAFDPSRLLDLHRPQRQCRSPAEMTRDGMAPIPSGMGRKAMAVYIAGALALSWILQLAAIRVWGLNSSATDLIFVVTMWSPTVLALIFVAVHRPARSGILWRMGHIRYLPLGVAVETAVAFSMVAILVGVAAGTMGWFTFERTGVAVGGGPWLLGTGFQVWPLYVLNIAVTAAAFSVLGLVAATGEEFAWRGFLQGHLIRQVGVRKGILLVAAVWWAWHLPGLLAGYNFPEYPIIGALILFPLQMIGASLFFGWLTLRSKSFWPAALAHAAVNSVQQGVIDNLVTTVPTLYIDGLRTVLILAVGLACWARLDKATD